MRLRETAIVSGGLLAQQATVFATGILIGRILGPAAFGALGTLKSLSATVLIVAPLGLDLALLKHASFYGRRPRELQTVSRALRLFVASLVLVLLGLVLAGLGPVLQDIYPDIPGFTALCAVTLAGLVFAADVQISGALYRVADRAAAYALIVNYAQSALRLVLSAIVIAAGGGVLGLTVVNAGVFAYSFLMIAADRGGVGVRPLAMRTRAVARKAGAVLGESLWMAVSLLVYQSIRLLDILVLAALSTTQVTGEYTAMSSVAQLIQIYPIATSQTLGPRIALAYRQGDRAAIIEALREYLRKATILGGFLFGGVAVFGTDLDLVFGRGFNFDWPLPVLLGCGWLVSATLAPFGYVLSMTGRHRQEVAILAAGAVLLAIGLFALIPGMAATGAALAVMITFVAVNAIRCSYVVRCVGANPLQLSDMLPPLAFLAAAFVARQATLLAAPRSFVLLVLGCILYGLLAAPAGYALANPGERRTILRALPRLRRAG